MPEGASKNELISAEANSTAPYPLSPDDHLLRRADERLMAVSTPGCDSTAAEAADEPWDADEADPRPPPPKRQPPMGRSEREPGCQSTANPVVETTRGGGAPVHDAPEPNEGDPSGAPPKRAVRDPKAQLTLQAAVPTTHPTATKSTTSAAIIRCHRGALATRG